MQQNILKAKYKQYQTICLVACNQIALDLSLVILCYQLTGPALQTPGETGLSSDGERPVASKLGRVKLTHLLTSS